MTQTLADELERLGKLATKGNWLNGHYGRHDEMGRQIVDGYTVEANTREGSFVIRNIVAAEVLHQDDAALIVALRNNLPAIIAALRAQQERGEG